MAEFFFVWMFAATRACGFCGAQAGDGRLPQEIQRPPQVKSKRNVQVASLAVRSETLFFFARLAF